MNRQYKEGTATYMKGWRKRNPEANFLRHFKYWLKSQYNLTLVQYKALLLAQGGKCKICGKVLDLPRPERRNSAASAVVDHNHETGQVRGILCSACNMALGMFCDNPEVLRSAARHVEIPVHIIGWQQAQNILREQAHQES